MFGESFPDVEAGRARGGRSDAGPADGGGAGGSPRADPRPAPVAGRLRRRAPSLGAAVTVAGRQLERTAREAGSSTGAASRRSRSRACGRRRARSRPPSCARPSPPTPRAMAKVVPALSRHLGTELPGSSTGSRSWTGPRWVRANTAAFASLIGQLEGELLDQVAARRAPGSPRRRSRSRTAGSRRASSGSCSGSWARASSASTTSRCCPPRRRPGGCCSSRRTSARRRATSTCRSTRSGPGSRSTRRPTRSSSRRTRGSGRTSPAAWSASSSLFSEDAASLGRDALRRSGAALRGDGRRDDQHWLERLMSAEQRRLFRETQAVMSLLEGFSDYVMDEVGPGPRARRRADPRPLPRAAPAAHPVRAGHAADHRAGPQDGAVP